MKLKDVKKWENLSINDVAVWENSHLPLVQILASCGLNYQWTSNLKEIKKIIRDNEIELSWKAFLKYTELSSKEISDIDIDYIHSFLMGADCITEKWISIFSNIRNKKVTFDYWGYKVLDKNN